MKEYKVFVEIDGKTKEFYVYADRFEYQTDTGICVFARGKGADYEIVALFKNSIKAIICNTEEYKKRALEMAKET